MTAILPDDLQERLRLLAIVQHKTPEQVIAGLVAAEADRVLGPKRGPMPTGEAGDKIWQAHGWTSRPIVSPEKAAEADRRLAKAQDDAEHACGDGEGGTVAA